jgi:hypothetical protein
MARWLGPGNPETLTSCNPVPYVSGFPFSEGYSFTERFRVPLNVSRLSDNLTRISIGAFVPASEAVAAPAGTVSVTCIISVAGCLLADGTPTGSYTHRFTFLYTSEAQPAQLLNFPVPAPAGSLTVTAARLEYNVLQNNVLSPTDNTAWMPAGVVEAGYWG